VACSRSGGKDPTSNPRTPGQPLVISNDSDLKEPITVAQRELGLIVGVINPHPPQRRSRALQPMFFKQIRESALRTYQFPRVLADADGKIHKPARW
jgi:hypothetical protein